LNWPERGSQNKEKKGKDEKGKDEKEKDEKVKDEKEKDEKEKDEKEKDEKDCPSQPVQPFIPSLVPSPQHTERIYPR
jgi:hypothetical protein